MRHLVARAAAIAVLLSCPSALAVTRAESVARAKEWVAAQMPYCQCANHASDSHGVCDRPDNALWDPYRSDCSGLVSWAWGLAPPGHVTSTFAPYSGSVSHQIAPSELLPGDALNINENGTHHVVLFAGWAGSNVAHVIQESSWGKPANEAFWSVTIDGDRVVSWAPFIPIRFNSIQEDCDAHCEGSTIVAADCGKGDCAAYGAGCVDDSLGVRCVFSLCPALGEIDVCLPDGKTLGHCKDGALTSQGDCSQFAAWCSTAGGKPAHCASVFCVASPTDVAKPHDTCGINGSVLHCDDNGQPKESTCAAGEKCSAVPAPHCQPNNGCPATGDVKLCVGEIAARCYEGTLVDGIDCKKQGETCQMVGNAPTCKTDAGGDPGMAGAGGASAGAGGAAGKAGSTAGAAGTGAKAGNATAGNTGTGGSTAGAAGKAGGAGVAGKTNGATGGGNQTVSLPAEQPETESGSCAFAARSSNGGLGLSLLALSLAGLCARRRTLAAAKRSLCVLLCTAGAASCAVRLPVNRLSTTTKSPSAPPPSPRPRVGDLLVDGGFVARDVVESIAIQARVSASRIGDALVAQQLVSETDLYRTLANQHGIRFVPLDELVRKLDLVATDAVPRAFLEREGMLPIAKADGDVIVATTNPFADGGDIAKALSARRAAMCLVTPTDYRRLWMLVDVRRGRAVREPNGGRPSAEGGDLLTTDLHGTEARHIAVFETLLLEAISERASDLHLERYGEDVRVRLRIDGDLHDFDRIKLSPHDLVGLVNVIKINANLDIAERRIPQGGRIRRRAGDHAYDLRVQVQPALHGEHVVIRLLPQDSKILTIEDIGFPVELANEYRRMLDGPGGLLLVVGPTGSGKSTTLYAGLQHIARDTTRKAITVEDPIEYSIRGVQQTQVRPEIGFSFADAMRAFVREDPDVILVGEIRDKETALEAIRASQTGHLVLSTLHCNDAVDAVQRLLDLDMHPNSIASELLAVFAQRLAKRICQACRVETQPDPTIMRELFPDGAPPDFRAFKGKGCEACGGHGTYGRVAAVEFMRTGPAVRRGISKAAALDDLRALALDGGLVTLRDTAMSHVAHGTIPLEELRWILPVERMAAERA